MSGLRKVLVLCFVIFAVSVEAAYKCREVTPQACPACDYKWTDTYREYALRMLNAGGPADGTCSGAVKYIHEGSIFNLKNNACCCLSTYQSASPPSVLACPDNLGMELDELVSDYFKRFAAAQPNATANGVCGAGTYKFTFAQSLTGLSHDICACVPNNKAYI